MRRSILIFSLLTVACGNASSDDTDSGTDKTPRVCEPGRQVECACQGGSSGVQRCLDDGARWSTCECMPTHDAGHDAATVDASKDAVHTDAGEVDDARSDSHSNDAPIDSAHDAEAEPEPECTVDTDCPGDVTECSAPRCVDGACTIVHAADGAEVAAQTPGDCKKAVCNGAGKIVSRPDLDDVPKDTPYDCVKPVCTDEGLVQEPTHGEYCNLDCSSPPCGVSDPYGSDGISDWGVCDKSTCKKELPVMCKVATGSTYKIYQGCVRYLGPLVDKYSISFKEPGDSVSRPSNRCWGMNDRGYCPPGRRCAVVHEDVYWGECLPTP